jgi:hypothetical protein
MNHNDGGQGTEMWLAKVIMMEVEISVLNMVMDLVMEHIFRDRVGHWYCLLALFMDLSKR